MPVKYGSDYKLARAILKRVADEVTGKYVPDARAAWGRVVEKYLSEDETVEPVVTLVANDNWVEFSVRYAVDYRVRRIVKDQLFTRILEELDKTDGRVGIASATIHLVQTPVLDVRLTEKVEKPGGQ